MPVRTLVAIFALGVFVQGLFASRVSAQDQNARVAIRVPVDAAEQEVEARTGVAVPPDRRLRRRPPPPLSDQELQAALENARPEVRQCLELRPGPARATARVRIDRQARVTVRVSARPRDAQVEACVDLAVRRWTQPLATRWITRTVSATLTERNGDVVIIPPPHPPPPPPPPPPPGGQYDESQVHAALDAMRSSIIECVSDLSPSTPGRMTLRVTVHPNGGMTLVGVDLPSGVRGPGSLGCLASRVGFLRVAPPPADRTVAHAVELGRP